MRASSVGAPKSNSWLPKVATSSPSWFHAAIICSPRSTADMMDGEIVSPASASMVCGDSARVRATRVAIRAIPPFWPSRSAGSRT